MNTQCQYYYRLKSPATSPSQGMGIGIGKREKGKGKKGEWKDSEKEEEWNTQYSSGIDSKGCVSLCGSIANWLISICYHLPIIIPKVSRMTEKREIIQSQSLPPCPAPCFGSLWPLSPCSPYPLVLPLEVHVVWRASIPHGREAQTHQVIECLIMTYQIILYSTTVEPRPPLSFRKGA